MKYKLEDICIVQSGGTPSRSNTDYYNSAYIPWAKIRDFEQGDIIESTEESISEQGLESIGNRVFDPGTLLLAMYGSVGKTAISGVRLSCNQAILGINTKDKDLVDNRYLKYWFDFHKAQLIFKSKGGALKNLNSKYVKNLEIDIPSIEEQKNIISYLENIESLILKRNTSKELIIQLFESFFLSFFGDPINNEYGWKKIPLEKVTNLITDGTHKTPNYVEDGKLFLSAKNITEKGIDWNNVKYITESEYHSLESRGVPEKGDILLTKSGTLGKVAIVERSIEFGFYESLALIKVNSEIFNSYFLAGLINSKAIQFVFLKKRKGVAVKHLHLNTLRELEVIVPPIELQIKFEKAYKYLSELEFKVNRSLAFLQELHMASVYNTFSSNLKRGLNEIDELLADDIELELLLNTINASDYESEDEYDIDIRKLHGILNRTKQLNKTDKNNRKGIVQSLKGTDEVRIETTKEYKNRLNNEVTQN